MRFWLPCISLCALILNFSFATAAPFGAKSVLPASKGKHNQYISEGIIRGGDPLSHPTTLDKVRWGRKLGYERIVLDLKSEGIEWQQKVPPYFQVGVDPVAGKIDVGIRYIDYRNVSQADIAKSIAQSGLIRSAYFAPKLEGSLASLQFKTTTPVKVESFYLINPPRIILDVQAK